MTGWRKSGNKFGAVKTTVDSVTFDSKGEAGRYQQLKLLQRAGKIYELELQPSYDITINGIHICKVKLDFRYVDHDTRKVVVEDFKGRDTPVSRLKRKLLHAQHGVIVTLV
jgi:hypothetical protein